MTAVVQWSCISFLYTLLLELQPQQESLSVSDELYVNRHCQHFIIDPTIGLTHTVTKLF